MTRNEMSRVIKAMKATYPKYYMGMSQDDVEGMLDVWSGLFANYKLSTVMAGLQAFIMADTKGFPPSPGQIVDIIHKTAASGTHLTATEAWALVRRAVSNSSYHAEEEFERLPDIVKRAVGSPGNIRELAAVDESEFETVEKSHFIRAYNTELLRMQEQEKIPYDVRLTISEGMESLKSGETIKEIADKVKQKGMIE